MSGPETLDPRIHAYRVDLADARLAGRVIAQRFEEGALFRVSVALAPFQSRPEPIATRTATKLLGETLRVFDIHDDWAWAQSELDGYVGYVRTRLLVEGSFDEQAAASGAPATVIAPRAPIFLQPSAKGRSLRWAPMGARIALDQATPVDNGFHPIAGDGAGGWIYGAHVRQFAEAPSADWVAAAETFLHAPYLWGGDSVEGVDCSGLIAAARRSVGLSAPRDSDLQEQALGAPLPEGAALERGDLVFWRGHVGVMTDATTLLHANAYAMAVRAEPVATAIARIEEAGYGRPTSIRRIAVEG